MRASCAALLLLAIAGCGTEPNEKDRPTSPTTPSKHSGEQGPAVVYTHAKGDTRPQYIPDKTKNVETVAVGRTLSSGVGDAVDGGSWAFYTHAYGKVTFDDRTTKEHKPITLVYDNWSGKLAAIEAN